VAILSNTNKQTNDRIFLMTTTNATLCQGDCGKTQQPSRDPKFTLLWVNIQWNTYLAGIRRGKDGDHY